MQKVALITGCSSGVGLQTAVQLAKANYKVYASMRDTNKSSTLQQAASDAKLKINILQLDVQSDDSVKKAVQTIVSDSGGVDVLVNNAGYGYFRSLEQASFAEVHELMDVNYFGVVRCLQAVLPHMRAKKAGHVLTVSSIGGLVGQPMNEVYCASKFALEGLMESLATYMPKYFNIKMTLIEPAGIRTEFVNRVMGDVQKTGGIKQDAYAGVVKAYVEASRALGLFDANGQTPAEVAAVIVKCIVDGTAAVRVQTSAFAQEFTKVKLGDDADGLKQLSKVQKELLGI